MNLIASICVVLLFACAHKKNLVKHSNIPPDLIPNSLVIDSIDVIYNKIKIFKDDIIDLSQFNLFRTTENDLLEVITQKDVDKDIKEIDSKRIVIDYINEKVINAAFAKANIKPVSSKMAKSIKVTKSFAKKLTLYEDINYITLYPDKGPIFGLSSRYALIIEELNVGRYNEAGTTTPNGFGGYIETYGPSGIEISLIYYIWDNKKQQVLTFKKSLDREPTLLKINKNNLDVITSRLADDLLKGTVIKLN